MRIPTTLAAAGALLALCAPGANAATKVVTTYDATFTGSGSYDRTDRLTVPSGSQTIKESALWEFTSTAVLRFENTKLVGQTKTPVTLNASGTRSVTLVTPDSTLSGTCTGDHARPSDEGLAYDPYPSGTESRVEWVAYDSLLIPMECDATLGGLPMDLALDGGFTSAIGSFVLPPEALDAGQVIQLFKSDPDTPCPGRGAMTTQCAFEWSGQVRITKKSTEIVDDAKSAPAPSPGPVVAPVTPAASAGAVDLLEQIKAQLQPGKALLSVACSAACKGTASLYPRAGAKPRAAAAKPLVTKRFSLRKAGRLRVAVPLGKRARSVVRRAGGARIVVSTQPAAGGRLSKRTVNVRAPR